MLIFLLSKVNLTPGGQSLNSKDLVTETVIHVFIQQTPESLV